MKSINRHIQVSTGSTGGKLGLLGPPGRPRLGGDPVRAATREA